MHQNFTNQILHRQIVITRVMCLVHLIVMCAVQFAMISNTIHHHPVVMMHLEDMMSLWECVRFCMEFVGNDEFLELHGPAISQIGLFN